MTPEDKLLIGKSVDAIYIDSSKTVIKLRVENGYIDLATESDCCSNTWIEHINSVESFKNSTIIDITRQDLGEVIPTKQERDLLYAFRIKFKAATKYNEYEAEFAIEFRNSSNGYYGGWINILQGDSSLADFKELTEDF